MQKLLLLFLCGVIAFFQYELWYGKGGFYDSYQLQGKIGDQMKLNKDLQARNNVIIEKLDELKGSPDLMEARARRELGLIKSNEMLVNLPATGKSTDN